jgi:hypothetical protein
MDNGLLVPALGPRNPTHEERQIHRRPDGHWPSQKQAEALLNTPDITTLKARAADEW